MRGAPLELDRGHTEPRRHGPAHHEGHAMTAVTSPPAVDGDALMGFVFRAIDEVGASLNAELVVMGDRLGYYLPLAEQGPQTANSLAHLTSTAEPYAREWLSA